MNATRTADEAGQPAGGAPSAERGKEPSTAPRRTAQRSQAAEKKTACPLNSAVCRYLERQRWDLTSEKDVAEHLRRGMTDEREIEKLATSICQWKEIPSQEPKASKLVAIAAAIQKPVDELLGRPTDVPGASGAGHAPGSKDWVREFMRQAYRLSCYAVFPKQAAVDEWRDAADRIPEEDTPARIAMATKWTKLIRVFDASMRLRDECRLATDADVQKQTMYNMIRYRLQWIQKSDKTRGSRLAEIARAESFGGLIEAVCQNRRNGRYERYPSLLQRDGDPEVLSLRVSFDTLPCADDELGWIVYYMWGPVLAESAIERLLNT